MAKILKNSSSAVMVLINQLKSGGVVSFPTETVYALACDPSNDAAVAKLYDLKKREQKKPLSLLVKDLEQLKKYAQVDGRIEKFITKFSPGPMTYVLPKKIGTGLSELINSTDSTIGVRIPDCPIAQEILGVFSGPIIGTSTNFSGEESAIDVSGINSELLESIDVVIDGGKTKYCMGSTIIDLTNPDEIKILRKGVITDLSE
jgi:tRNA threonylcarbamoyl adenosine modification protein (Sua5/YciO/YrdC/YwlC family)